MASEQAAAGSCPTAQVVGNAFVHQYYHILHQSPNLVFRFYQDSSKLGRPGADGGMSIVTTTQEINEKILSMDYSGLMAEIKTVDAQDSLNGGVLVLVSGELISKDNGKRNFTQSFFLAPQDRGYYVLNDIFRYVEEVGHPVVNNGVANNVDEEVHEELPTRELEPAPMQESHVVDQGALMSEEDHNGEEVYNPSDDEEGSVVDEEPVVEEVVDEHNSGQQHLTDSTSSSALEEAPKKSYASIVKVMKESSALSPSPASSPAKPLAPERQVVPTSSAAPVVETSVSSLSAVENSSVQEAEAADGNSIYIKGLPFNATPSQLEEEFRRFGPIKSGGVQVRSNKQQGFCFGFVEFESSSSVQSAIEASPLTIGGRQAYVEEKRPSIARGHFPSGRGGFRNDGLRGGRGNYGGGRSYGRGDFNYRSDFAYRTGQEGSSNRGGEGGYQRVDHAGNGGSRVNRAGSFNMNGPTKAVAPRVSAPA
ncbi:putative G3BP-like protein [Nymphaea thermarum]|nr:putative G3BP-like protein [Nymphaea thermarum]